MPSHSLWSAIAVAVLAGSMFAPMPTPEGRSSPSNVRRSRLLSCDAPLGAPCTSHRLLQPDTLRTTSRHVSRITNRERRRKNLPRLEAEKTLRRIACRHSRDMLARDFFRHENPDGEGSSDRVAAQHRRLVGEAAENIWGQSGRRHEDAPSLANRIVEQWMDSPPHRENILRPGLTHVGVCILREGTTIRSTQVFARVRAYLADPLPRTATAGDTLEATVAETNSASAAITQYDFWNPNTERQIQPPAPFRDSLFLPKTTGTMRPRFYIPKADRYTVHQGPEIRIVSPE